MGVKQLTSYVNQHFAILYREEIDLRGQKLVFDGGALYYGLIRNSNIRFGGDYNILYKDFKTFFLQLRNIGIIPYVVLDGGANIPIKNNTICQRYERDVKNLQNLSNLRMHGQNLPKPAFVKMVFIEVLNDLCINFVLTKGEADMLVAALANQLRCPLVSGDSDFFVTHVTNGVLPLDPILKLKPSSRKCVQYRSINLAQHLNVPQELLPLIAVVMGNDFSDEKLLERIQKNCGVRNSLGTLMQLNERVKQIGKYICQFHTMENAIAMLSGGDQELVSHIRYVLREFDLSSVENYCAEIYPILNSCQSFSEKISPILSAEKSVESFVMHACHHGLANPCLIDIYFKSTHFIRTQCENIAQKASAEASEKLRTYIYLLLKYEKGVDADVKISEFKRVGAAYRETSICISIEEWMQYYPVDILTGDYCEADKIRILCDITLFPTDRLVCISEQHHLFLLATKFWINESSSAGIKLKVEHTQALVICYIQLLTSEELSNENESLDLMVANHYCRWQSILFYLTLLNVIFRYPFPTLRLSRVYNGNQVHHLYHTLKRGTSPYGILFEHDHALYNTIMDIIH